MLETALTTGLIALLTAAAGYVLGRRRPWRTAAHQSPTPASLKHGAPPGKLDTPNIAPPPGDAAFSLALAARHHALGAWAWDSRDDTLSWDARCGEHFAFSTDQSQAQGELWWGRIRPEEAPGFKTMLLDALTQQREHRAELRVVWPNGSIRHLGVAFAPLDPARIGGICWDLTQQRHTEEALCSASGELQVLIDKIPAGISYWDSNLFNSFANQTCAAWYGQTPAQLKGKHIGEIIGNASYMEALPRLDVARRGDTVSFESALLAPGGVPRVLLITLKPDTLAGTVRGIYAYAIDVSSLKQAERARETAENRLQNVLDGASEFAIIATDADGRINVFNAGAERLLGYSAEEIVGRQTPAIFHDAAELAEHGKSLSVLHGENIEGFEIFVHSARLGTPETREWTYIRKDGRRVPVSLTVTEVIDEHRVLVGFVGVARDISQDKAAAESLRQLNQTLSAQIQTAQQAREDFETLFEHAPGALIVVNADGIIRKANEVAHNLFAYPSGSLLGLSVETLVPQELRTLHHKQRSHFGRNVPDRIKQRGRSLRALRKDGSEFETEITLSPLEVDGTPCTIAAIWDISAQRHLQDHMRQAMEHADAASKAKSSFLANMSHEIRTPLNAVLGMAQLLDSTQLSVEQRKQVHMIQQAGQSLLVVFNDILDLSRIEAGRMELAYARLVLDDLLDRVAAGMVASAAHKPLELVIDMAPELPFAVYGDALRMQQVLNSLLDNAIKFTDSGKVVLRIEPGEHSGQMVTLRFRVSDTGIGMSKEHVARLFTPFSQADTSVTRRFGGTGLGLSIAQHLVKLMQGEITVFSSLGAGSEFVVDIPCETPPATELLETSTQQLAGPVLVLCHSDALRGSLLDLLARLGQQAIETSDADTILSTCQQHAPPYALLMLDHTQCDEGLLAALRAAQSPPVCLLATHANLSEARHLVDIGLADGLLTSPFTSKAVRSAISTVRARTYAMPQAPLAGRRILLAEDNELNQLVARGMLEEAGATVELASNGQIVLEMLARADANFDAILMDAQMPVMDGYEAAEHIRHTMKRMLPILAMSAGVSQAEQARCRQAGMDRFIAKPIDADALTQALLELIGDTSPGPQHPPDANAAAHASNGFDALLALSSNEGVRRSLIGSVRQLVEEDMAPLNHARRLLANKDYASLSRHMHSLRGALGNFGASEFGSIASSIEQRLKDGLYEQDDKDIEALLLQAEQHFQHLLRAASSWLSKQRADRGAAAGTAIALPSAADLRALIDMFEAQSFNALESFEQIRASLAQRNAKDVKAIDQFLDRLDFPAAAKRLRELAHSLGLE